MKKIVLAVLTIGLLGFFASMMTEKSVRAGITCSLPIILQNNTTADATQVMADFNALVGCFNSVATLTSVTCGTGLDGGIITITGTCSLSAARRTMPTVQTFQVGTGSTYTTPANVQWIEVLMVGGGGGGAGTTGNGGTGGNTTFSTGTAGGGSGGITSGAGAGGPFFGCTWGILGQTGLQGVQSISGVSNGTGGAGGSSPYWSGGGAGGVGATGSSGIALTGGGGGGYGPTSASSFAGGGGGGSGGFCRLILINPAATYPVAVGAGGAGGTGAQAGGNGAQGYIVVTEHYGT